MSETDSGLIEQKVDQAIDALEETDTDLWITFCRETSEIDEPCLPFLLGFDVVWPTMVIISRDGRKDVVIGRHDAENAESLGVYDVHPYDESLEEEIERIIGEEDPDEIAVNYSRDNNIADGLTHGMYLRLSELLDGHELVSADEVVSRMRGKKSEEEKKRIREAARITELFLSDAVNEFEYGWEEEDFADFLHHRMRDEDLESAWSWDYCPSVHAGPESEIGHTMPGEICLEPGDLLHIDFGVKYRGYAADIQRVYYLPEKGEDKGIDIPEGLQEAFEDVRDAIDAGFEALEPGVKGYEVDSAARELISSRGWDEYPHALGHQVGRNAHDGGALLGPLWDRYGDTPEKEVREDEIYTLELGVETEFGYVGQEEMVEVGEDGNEFVVEPQEEIRIIQEN